MVAVSHAPAKLGTSPPIGPLIDYCQKRVAFTRSQNFYNNIENLLLLQKVLGLRYF